MNLILSPTEKGVALIADIVPDGINVGCGSTGPGKPVYASIAASYGPDDLGFMLAVCEHMERQGRNPMVALFEDNVQLVYRLSPVPKEILESIASTLPARMQPRTLYVTSMADAFPDSAGQAMFMRCWEKDKAFVFFVYRAEQLLKERTVGQPVFRASGKVVTREFIPLE